MTETLPAVNLLPWRPQRRRQQCRTFNFLLLGVLVMAVLINTGLGMVMRHQTQALAANTEDLHQQLAQVLAEHHRLSDASAELDAAAHWVSAGQWLDTLASTTPDGVRWQALRWHHTSDQWQLRFEAAELAVVTPWARDWQADIEVSEQGGEDLIEGVMAGQLSSVSALQWRQDNALVD